MDYNHDNYVYLEKWETRVVKLLLQLLSIAGATIILQYIGKVIVDAIIKKERGE